MAKQIKLIIGISGASGAELGLKFVSTILLLDSDITLYVVISNGAKKVLEAENNIEFDKLLESRFVNLQNKSLESSIKILQNYTNRLRIFDDNSLDSPISSGSFKIDGMAITPCSINTLSKIACGISDTLITRSALVCLKERRKLLVSPREMPLNSIMLNNMLTLSNLGVIVSPPILGYYSNITNLEQMEDFLFGKWLDSLDIEHSLFERWKGKKYKIKV